LDILNFFLDYNYLGVKKKYLCGKDYDIFTYKGSTISMNSNLKYL